MPEVEPAGDVGRRAFIDLHCHTSASFDSLASPASIVSAARRRGLTHLSITDHDTIDGALRARDAAPIGLTVIVGEEIRTADGDLVAAFIEHAIPPGLPAVDAVAAVREQGGLVGIPHPFDRFRGSVARGGMLARPGLLALASLVDWVEAWNARLFVGDGNARAADLAREVGLPGVAVSDAHSVPEVAVAYTVLDVAAGDPSTSAGLLAALAAGPALVTGRASIYVRALTPLAKVVQRARGQGRLRP